MTLCDEIIAGLLKKEGKDGYQLLKDFTRGKNINKSELKQFILDNLNKKDSTYLITTFFINN